MSSPVASALYLDDGQSLPIEPECLARGGEGLIYRIRGTEGFLAKIYTNPPDDGRVAKLRGMVASHNNALLDAAAWPVGLITNQPGNSGRVVGFTMPEVVGHRELHQLFSPVERKRYFPNANWRMLALAGSNLSRVVAAIHQSGGVVGDLNQNNVLVSARATVKLIDCDSFQFRRADGHYWTSDVGKEEYLPPELQSVTLRGLVRTPNQDNFALAVLIFQLLFMARHPFTGRHNRPNDLPIGEAILQGAYFYGRNAASKGLSPPPGIITPAVLPQQTAELFEQAFLATERPSASDWSEHLLQFANTIKPCDQTARHLYYVQAGACPWCALKNATKIDFFPELLQDKFQAEPGTDYLEISINPESLKSTIDAIPLFSMKYKRPTFRVAQLRPATKPPENLVRPAAIELLAEPPEPTSADSALALILKYLCLPLIGLSLIVALQNTTNGLYGMLFTALLYGISTVVSKIQMQKLRRDWVQSCGQIAQANEELKLNWNLSNQGWLEELEKRRVQRDGVLGRLVEREHHWTGWLNQIRDSDKALRQEAKALLQTITGHLESYKQELELQSRARLAQAVDTWLEGHLIRDADIALIGRTRVATLASFGIETAADVVRLVQNQAFYVPGFGPKLMNNLWYWAAGVQAKYQPNPAQAMPVDLGMRIKAKYEIQIRANESRLFAIIDDLKGFVPLVESKRPKTELYFQLTTKEYLEFDRDVKLMEV